MKLTDDQRKELVAVLNREGCAPGSSLHSWRCEDKDRYPEPCDCVAGVVDELAPLIEGWMSPAPCEMTHTPPFDFAQCETHDETFPLGEECRFKDREPWEVFAEEADEQRQRAVKAEMASARCPECRAPLEHCSACGATFSASRRLLP